MPPSLLPLCTEVIAFIGVFATTAATETAGAGACTDTGAATAGCVDTGAGDICILASGADFD